jgi:DNA-binding GntR family transcriptional regulator
MLLHMNTDANTEQYMSKNNTSTLRFQAYEAIKDRILHLDLRPGEKIFESALANRLNVSRTPVREALVMLEHEKLVVCDESLGFQVRRLTPQDVREYFALRNAIEEFALSLVVENITASEIEILRRSITNAGKIVVGGEIAAIIDCETEFHEIIYKAAKSDLLFEMVSNLVARFQWLRALALSVPGAAASSLSQHSRMVDLIEAKNTKGVKKLMRSHLNEAEKKILCLPGILL